MQYTTNYNSPLGPIKLACDDIGLTGLWFENSRYYEKQIDPEQVERWHPHLQGAIDWLERYFEGEEVERPVLHLIGTEFQRDVWEELLKIPFGEVRTYKEIAEAVAENRGIARMSAQAVGGAIGHNPVSIIVPCHRVIAADGSLTGYSGGLDKKEALLEHEHAR